jgi:uncharacterized protein YihD (DUF1040 family)
MKKIRLTIVMSVTDEFFAAELKDLKNDILSGKYQREMVDDAKDKGVKKVKVTYEELK